MSQAYVQLSSATVKARKKGKLPWDSFYDEGTLVLADFAEEYQTQEQYVLEVEYLRSDRVILH